MDEITIFYVVKDQKTGKIEDCGAFVTDRPYYNMGKLLADIDPYSGSKVVDFENPEGKFAQYLVIKKNPKFIKSEFNDFPQAYLDAMDEPKPRYLTCVDPENNNYKFYQIEIKSGRTHVSYGRIGDDNGRFGLREYEYDLDMYWVKYFEKLSKGYIDQSEIKNFDKKEVKEAPVEKSVKMAKIKSKQVSEIVDLLISKARDFVQKNYNYTSGKKNDGFSMAAVDKVSKLLDEMQGLLNENGDLKNATLFKEKYTAVISVLPRYIDNVKWQIDRAAQRPQQTIDEERDLLEALRVVIENDELAKKNKNKDATVLDKTGLKIKPVTFNEKLEIQKQMGNKVGCLSRALKVKNEKTEKAYNECLQRKGIRKEGCKLLFHGSRTENWWSIMTKGMSLNPNAVITGKMFGQGLYFAPKAEKSMGYTDQSGSYWAHGTSSKGYLALYEVAMGKEYHPGHILGSSFRGSDLRHGCHSVYARGGTVGLRNDEAIIYDEHQCTIRYLIETGRERTLDYKMNLQDLMVRSFTLGEPYKSDKGIELPIVMMSKTGRTELKKAVGCEMKKPVLCMQNDKVTVYDAADQNGHNYHNLSSGDELFFHDRAADKLCQSCKLERTEEGLERFYKEVGKEFFLPERPDKPVTFQSDEKEMVNMEQEETEKEIEIER